MNTGFFKRPANKKPMPTFPKPPKPKHIPDPTRDHIPVAAPDAPGVFCVTERGFDAPHPRLNALHEFKAFNVGGTWDAAQKAEVDRVAPIWKAFRKGDVTARDQLPRNLYVQPGVRLPDPIPTVFTAGRRDAFYVREDIANIFRQHNLGEAALLPVDIYDVDGLNTYDARAYLLAPGTFRPTLDIRTSKLSKNRYASYPEFSVYREKETWHDLTPLTQPDDGLAVWWDDKIINSVFFSAALVSDLKGTGFEQDVIVGRIGPGPL
ncbi:hypothetical protein [Tateyamaria sp. ANG-S1]|uniref:hypothetical protein n=1 Tax=Tateyamaria sp. ANG-S1 TaxID=1577905 RepID=UPI00057C64D7|nr:hypothetical protein [Tateyamaria sp. ANG-S1]KIC50094.1 hypothetical protein RA29_10935 [Tateyamaria sp. ANG-S1]